MDNKVEGGMNQGHQSGSGRLRWSRGLMRLWAAATLLWFLALAVVIVAVPDFNWRLREQGTVSVPAPPCASGQPTCQPWERSWDGVELPPGSIVGDGTFTLPGAISPWRVAMAALCPPVAVLFLGALLAWVGAGFRGARERA